MCNRTFDSLVGVKIRGSVGEPWDFASEAGANLYVYTGNDPVNYVDPSGNWAFLIPMAIGALEGGAIDLGLQLATHGGNWDCINWGQVGIQAGIGAGVAGLGSAVSAYRAARAHLGRHT